MKTKLMTRFLILITLPAFSFVLSTCSAYDLGNEGKRVFEVNNPDNPTWEDNINKIVEFKCATCHTTKEPWYKPKNAETKLIPQNPNFRLENIALREFFDLENSEMMKKVKLCIEKTCGENGDVPMPPKFATPLNELEKKALLNFVSAFIKEEPKNANLSESFANNCATCHGADGRSSSTYPKLGGPGANAVTLDQFKNIIQNGRGGMPKISGYDISKADADFAVLYGAN